MTPVAPSPIASSSGGSRLLTGLLVLAVVGLAVLIVRWPEPPPDVQPPTAPGAVSIGETTCRSAALTWAAATDDREVTWYAVLRDGQVLAEVDGDVRSAVIEAAPAQEWQLQVKAQDEAGNVSPASETVTVTPPECGSDTKAPAAPGGVRVTADGTTVTMSWAAAGDDVGVTAYDVFRDGGKVGTVAGGAGERFSFVDFGVPPDSRHWYHVSARDEQGNRSAPSSGTEVTAGKACTVLCEVTVVAEDPATVSSLAPLPDGTVLYARRDQHEVLLLDPRTGQSRPLGTVPGTVGTGSSGLLGLAVAPTFAKDRWVYAFQTTATDSRIVRLRLRVGGLDGGSMESLVVGIPRGKVHNGGGLRFGPDGKLYVATGDAGVPRLAQNNASLAGKVLRFNPDGKVSSGNPFGGYIWSYGHRDPRGLAFDSRGKLWMQEYGDTVEDETNLVVKGGNYGWPLCEGTVSRSGTACESSTLVAPRYMFPAGEGGCGGLAAVRSVVYVACATGARLYRISLDGDDIADVQPVLAGTYGQLYTAASGADGAVWIASGGSGPGGTGTRFLRITLPPVS